MLVVLLSLLSLTSLHPSHGVSVSVSVEEVLTHQKHSLDLSAKVTASTQPRPEPVSAQAGPDTHREMTGVI